jgi:hypothetical protein
MVLRAKGPEGGDFDPENDPDQESLLSESMSTMNCLCWLSKSV